MNIAVHATDVRVHSDNGTNVNSVIFTREVDIPRGQIIEPLVSARVARDVRVLSSCSKGVGHRRRYRVLINES